MAVHLADHVAWREIEGATFIIDLRTKRMYGLNATGGEVWHALARTEDAGDELDAIGQRLAGAADVPAETRSRAVRRFCAELERLELVTGAGPCPPSSGDPDDVAPGAFLPPQVAWQEDLRSFGFSCARIETQNAACDQIPTT